MWVLLQDRISKVLRLRMWLVVSSVLLLWKGDKVQRGKRGCSDAGFIMLLICQQLGHPRDSSEVELFAACCGPAGLHGGAQLDGCLQLWAELRVELAECVPSGVVDL